MVVRPWNAHLVPTGAELNNFSIMMERNEGFRSDMVEKSSRFSGGERRQSRWIGSGGRQSFLVVKLKMKCTRLYEACEVEMTGMSLI